MICRIVSEPIVQTPTLVDLKSKIPTKCTSVVLPKYIPMDNLETHNNL